MFDLSVKPLYMALYTYSNSFFPLSVLLFGSSGALLGMVGVKLSGKYKKYQLRKSLKTTSKTQWNILTLTILNIEYNHIGQNYKSKGKHLA